MNNEISNERLEMISKYDTFVSLGEAEAMAKELLALRKAREGWKLVPVEPTRQMPQQVHPITEGTCHHCYATVNADCEENVLLSWRDMLASAPPPPEADDAPNS